STVAILYYDFAITVLPEIQYCWTQPRSRTAFMLFVGMRYLGLLGSIPIFFEYFLENENDHVSRNAPTCRELQLYHQAFIMTTQGIVAILILLRTYALYHGSKRVLVSLVAMYIGGAIHCVVALVTTQGPLSTKTPLHFKYPLCNTSLTDEQGIHLALAWSAMLWFDTVIFALTLYKAIQMRREISSGSLIERLFRDGTIYYGILVALNMTNIVTFLKTPSGSPMKGVASVMANVLSMTLTSRLMLNLRDPSLTSGRRIGGTSQRVDLPGLSTGRFSTRISFTRRPTTVTGTECLTMDELGSSVGSDCQDRV
ncbi:hypothetical protein BD413DRAFT_463774, partial [Trametes elegans]